MFADPTPDHSQPNDEAAVYRDDAAAYRDDALMARAAQNDADAFGELVRVHEKRVSRFALRMLCGGGTGGDRERAQDVTQETFLRVWRSRADYVPSGSFTSYLLRVAHRLCLDALRKAARQNTVPLDEWAGAWDAAPTPAASFAPTAPSAEQAALNRSLADAVRQAVADLPAHERAVFVLSHYENLPYHEIARILDCPIGTVASRKHHAVQHLRRALAPWQPGAKETS